MKILKLSIENIKNVKAAVLDIRDNWHLISVCGKNRAGKSAVLDSIYWALGGKPDVDQPIREDSDRGGIEVSLGDEGIELTVERQFKRKEEGGGYTTALKVTTSDNAVHRSPQKMLDSMIGAHSFDPFEFCRASKLEQYNQIKGFLDLDVNLDAKAAEYKALHEKRAVLNKIAKDARANLGEQPENVQRCDVTSVRQEYQLLWSSISEAKMGNARLKDALDSIREIDEDIARLSQKRKTLEWALTTSPRDIDDISKKAEEAKATLDAAEEANAKADLADKYAEKLTEVAEMDRRAEIVDEEMKGIKALVESAVANAKMPVDGLSLDPKSKRLLYNERDFSMCSTAEQLSICARLALHGNPKIRVIRIAEGSLLDSDCMEHLAKLAEEFDFQIWLECVQSEPADASGSFFIRDGEVVEEG